MLQHHIPEEEVRTKAVSHVIGTTEGKEEAIRGEMCVLVFQVRSEENTRIQIRPKKLMPGVLSAADMLAASTSGTAAPMV